MPLPNGIYRLSDSNGGRMLSLSGVKPGTGAGTQLVMLTEEEGTSEGFNWRIQYDASQNAYTIQHTTNGTYVSFEGTAIENAHLGAHPKPKFFDIYTEGSDLYRCDPSLPLPSQTIP
ncbi:hypothetical protein RhiJN_27647 [Ceratobasidium sp. AG-Ba]|nr:hypothetical protein RhiJN_13608 [Ceratobasidium sp. AG-Ba]QRV99628.1 hypothetical protein RhiJN_27647 [Ceratobasidium sp. AG-Ba]QRW14160.1 hypothetical protein RhiLY_13159 [Ceratobasidium sp. AG-Ba]